MDSYKRYTDPLLQAASEGCTEALLALVDPGGGFETQDRHQRTLLHLAAAEGHTKTVTAILGGGANPDRWDRFHLTPLHYAATNGHVPTTRTLLLRGANPEVQDHYRNTPLFMAASVGCSETVIALLDHGAVLGARNQGQSTVLHLAAENGCTETVLALLDRGIFVDAVDANRQTALHLAAGADRFQTVLALIDRGATIDAQDVDGQTPLHHQMRARTDGIATAAALIAAGSTQAAALSLESSARGFSNERRRVLALDALLAAAELGHQPLLDRALRSSSFQGLALDAQAERLQAAVKHAGHHAHFQAVAYLRAIQARHTMDATAVDTARLRPL